MAMKLKNNIKDNDTTIAISRCKYCNTALSMTYSDTVCFHTYANDGEIDGKRKGHANYCPFCGKKIGNEPYLHFYDTGIILRHLKTMDTFTYTYADLYNEREERKGQKEYLEQIKQEQEEESL